MTQYRLTFHTPLFSRGSYEDRPEIRPASIRGQLHWWFRALGNSHRVEQSVFGSVHSKPAAASKIIVRVSEIDGTTGKYDALPHKSGGQANPKQAYAPGTSCLLSFSTRLGGLNSDQSTAFENTLEAWFLMGTLGLRATRAAGSFSWEPTSPNGIASPNTISEYVSRCHQITKQTKLEVRFCSRPFDAAEQARRVVSDTIGGKNDFGGNDSLGRINYPLGKIGKGGRKTSPLRFRVLHLDGSYYILAIWDGRAEVTGNRPNDLEQAIELLQRKEKQIGELLSNAKNSVLE